MRNGYPQNHKFTYNTLGTENDTLIAAASLTLDYAGLAPTSQWKFTTAGIWLPNTNPPHIAVRIMYVRGSHEYMLCQYRSILNITAMMVVSPPFITKHEEAISAINVYITTAGVATVVKGFVGYEFIH